LEIYRPSSNVFVDSKSFPLSFTNVGIMATLVVGSFIKHCCAIPVVVFAQLVYEAREVV